MDSLYEQFRNNLQEQLSIYNKLFDLSKIQQEALIVRQSNKLLEIAEIQNQLLNELQPITAKGRELLIGLFNGRGLNPSEPTISELIPHLDTEQANSLEQILNEIQSSASKLKESNAINKELFDNALDFIRFTLQLLAGGSSLINNYPGNNENPNHSILVDERV